MADGGLRPGMVVSIVSCRLPNPIAVASQNADVESTQAEQAGRPPQQHRRQHRRVRCLFAADDLDAFQRGGWDAPEVNAAGFFSTESGTTSFPMSWRRPPVA